MAQTDQDKSDKPGETAAEPVKKAPAKSDKPVETNDDAPSPTQDELDAIKAGEYGNRALTSK